MKKIYFIVLIFLLSNFTACGNKKPVIPFATNPTNATKTKSLVTSSNELFLQYKVFYRDDFLILQATIQDASSGLFQFENLTIYTIKNGDDVQAYTKEFIYKKTEQQGIEIALFPFAEARFFRLAYKNWAGQDLATAWKKPVVAPAIPTPRFTNIYVRSDAYNILFLTLRFENLGDYGVHLYEKNNIFPSFSIKEDLIENNLGRDITGFLVRYVDGYGNESQEVDISNWF